MRRWDVDYPQEWQPPRSRGRRHNRRFRMRRTAIGHAPHNTRPPNANVVQSSTLGFFFSHAFAFLSGTGAAMDTPNCSHWHAERLAASREWANDRKASECRKAPVEFLHGYSGKIVLRPHRCNRIIACRLRCASVSARGYCGRCRGDARLRCGCLYNGAGRRECVRLRSGRALEQACHRPAGVRSTKREVRCSLKPEA